MRSKKDDGAATADRAGRRGFLKGAGIAATAAVVAPVASEAQATAPCTPRSAESVATGRCTQKSNSSAKGLGNRLRRGLCQPGRSTPGAGGTGFS